MKKIFSISLAIVLTAFLISCKSSKQEKQYVYDEELDEYVLVSPNDDDEIEYLSDEDIALLIPEPTEDFLGDFDPIQLQSLIGFTKFSGKLKPKELRKNYLVPRSNAVEFYYRDTVNEICFILNYQERQKLIEAGKQFLQDHEDHSFKKHKVTKKTAYYTSRCSFWFGVTSVVNGTDKNDYFVNYDIIDKHAYMVIAFVPSRVKDDHQLLTPNTKLYFSPSQVEELIEFLNQENLEAELSTLLKRAYTY